MGRTFPETLSGAAAIRGRSKYPRVLREVWKVEWRYITARGHAGGSAIDDSCVPSRLEDGETRNETQLTGLLLRANVGTFAL